MIYHTNLLIYWYTISTPKDCSIAGRQVWHIYINSPHFPPYYVTPPLNCLNWELSNLLQVLFPSNLTKVIRLCKNDAILQHKARVNVESFIFWCAICHTGSAIKSAWKTLQSLQSWDWLQLPDLLLIGTIELPTFKLQIITLILRHLRMFASFLTCKTKRGSPNRK